MPEACITVRSQKMELDHATVRSRVFWGLQYSPVPNLRTGPYRSLDRTGLQNHTSVRSQNSEPDRLQISPVQSGPSPTVRSGQSTRCIASSHLSPIVLSRTDGLRGLPPIGWLTRCGPHRPVLSCCSGSGLVAPVRARGLAGRGSIGARTSVRRDLIGRIPDVLTGSCCWGDWE